ncbi:MAG: recombinase family protein [Caedimonadaceae bacterium]|jgi:DNA invertase Pin-like site-specific DNA recombinase|nr:MAG: recombinase family protein [Caedimonadaceae bacterium]
MAKVGYIFKADHYDGLEQDKAWMNDFGCVRIVEELSAHEKLRPAWKQLINCLERGDELVVSKFSNAVRGSRELAVLLEMCRVKVIRLISIHDKIDSKCELFPETSIADVLVMFGSLPEEAAALRRANAHVERLKANVIINKKVAIERIEREKNIVNMYNSGHSIDDIWKVSGFNSRSSVFRILNKYGVDLNRGKFKGPLGKRKNKEDE